MPQCGAHRPRGTKCCGRYWGSTTALQRSRSGATCTSTRTDEDEVADFLQAALARLDRESGPRVRADAGNDPSTDGDESDDYDSDDDHDPVTRIDLIRAVHLGFQLEFEGMGHFMHPKKVALSLGPLHSEGLVFRARSSSTSASSRPRLSTTARRVSRCSYRPTPWATATRLRASARGAARTRPIELAPVHRSGELFNCSDRNITTR